jgi:putative ABC transport system permease protein
LKPGTNEDEAALAIADFMRRRHRISDPAKDDFGVMTMSQALGIAKTVTDVMRFLLVTLAAISLLVGGVGIMNIMLVSVTERLHEIGIRKAFGANKDDVFRQFVIESITLTSLGGLIGTLLATIGIVVAGIAIKSAGFTWNLGFPLNSILIAITVAAITGFIFGLYPARKAAKLSTIEALKVD